MAARAVEESSCCCSRPLECVCPETNLTSSLFHVHQQDAALILSRLVVENFFSVQRY